MGRLYQQSIGAPHTTVIIIVIAAAVLLISAMNYGVYNPRRMNESRGPYLSADCETSFSQQARTGARTDRVRRQGPETCQYKVTRFFLAHPTSCILL